MAEAVYFAIVCTVAAVSISVVATTTVIKITEGDMIERVKLWYKMLDEKRRAKFKQWRDNAKL